MQCRDKRGPDTIYTGYLDRAGTLGSLWMGVKEMTGVEADAPESMPDHERMLFTRTGWHFLQVLHVFNTQKVSPPHAMELNARRLCFVEL